MNAEVYLLYLGAVAVFFATPPDTSRLLIISNAMKHGLRRSLWVIFGDLSANIIRMTAQAFGWINRISGGLMIGAAVLLGLRDVSPER